jgi:hypothetical protein
MYFETQTEDVMIYRRKTGLKLEEEFIYDVKTRLKADENKRRCFRQLSAAAPANTHTTDIQDTKMENSE